MSDEYHWEVKVEKAFHAGWIAGMEKLRQYGRGHLPSTRDFAPEFMEDAYVKFMEAEQLESGE